jgi:DNA modification methylase
MRQHRTSRAKPKNRTPRHVEATDNTGWKNHEPQPHPLGKNPGDVWTIATQPFSEAHFAVMPQALAERAILAGCKPGGTVLDPFSGSGTTGLAATKHGRKYVGIDLSADYLDLSLRTRFAQPGFDFNGEASV